MVRVFGAEGVSDEVTRPFLTSDVGVLKGVCGSGLRETGRRPVGRENGRSQYPICTVPFVFRLRMIRCVRTLPTLIPGWITEGATLSCG